MEFITNNLKMYAVAEKIIALLTRVGEIQTAVLMSAMHEDPELMRFALGFLLRFGLTEYDPRREIIKINRILQLIKERG